MEEIKEISELRDKFADLHSKASGLNTEQMLVFIYSPINTKFMESLTSEERTIHVRNMAHMFEKAMIDTAVKFDKVDKLKMSVGAVGDDKYVESVTKCCIL